MSQVTTEKLVEDLRLVVHDAEELLKATAGQAGEKVAHARARAEASLQSARERLAEAGGNVADRAREGAQRADALVHSNPWASIGVGAAVGLVVGLLLGRRNGGGSQ